MGYRYLNALILAALSAGAGLAADARGDPPLGRYEYSQVHMGGRARLVVYARNEASAERACMAAFRRIAELEDVMSDYRPASDLMRLCANAGGPPMVVPDSLFHVLQVARRLSEQTDGAFDVTVGPAVALWREARRARRLPSPEDLRRALTLVDWRSMVLDPARRTVRLLKPGMKLDLGGIAKGYAGDQAIEVLRRQGVSRALYEAGGDIVVGDPPPGSRGWWIRVARLGVGAVPDSLLLSNAAVSTSGDTEQFVEIDGRRYSHIVDPRTGLGLTTRVAATVVAPRGITSDSLATALCVLGPLEGREVARQHAGVRAYFHRAAETAASAARPASHRGPSGRIGGVGARTSDHLATGVIDRASARVIQCRGDRRAPCWGERRVCPRSRAGKIALVAGPRLGRASGESAARLAAVSRRCPECRLPLAATSRVGPSRCRSAPARWPRAAPRGDGPVPSRGGLRQPFTVDRLVRRHFFDLC